MGQGNSLKPEILRTLAFGSISGTYAKLGTPLVNPGVILMFQNFTDVTVTLSIDGSNDHFSLATGQTFYINATTNSPPGMDLQVDAGTQYWVKGTPGSGQVNLSSFYTWSIA